MARLFPNPPVGQVSPEQHKVFRALKKIPTPGTCAWMALRLGDGWQPDWMILHEQKTCYLITVSSSSLQVDLFSNGPAESPEAVALRDNEKLRRFLEETNPGDQPIFGAVIFPNINQAWLSDLQKRLPELDVALWGREMVRAEALARVLGETPSEHVFSDALIHRLRERICPEIAIPSELTAQPKATKRASLAPQFTTHLLNLDQEFLTKEDLQIPNNLLPLVESEKTSIVNGVAGSGKSLVVLYRLMLHEKVNPGSRILAITHNKPLCHELQMRLERIHPKTKVRWQTFYQFCGTMETSWKETVPDWTKSNRLNELRSKLPALQRLPIDFLTAEIDWIRDQAFDPPAVYLAASRAGRRRPLNESQRQAMLQLLDAYRSWLEETRQTDWPGIAETIWQKMLVNEIRPSIFDQIFIDEAQFFAPVWFRIVLRCLDPDLGRVFLVADPTQGFLKRRHSWQSLGIQARGQTTRLQKSYRNCREILAFATAFYRSRLPDDDEEVNLSQAADLEELPEGEAPVFRLATKQQDESTVVINEILEALQRGANAGNYLILLTNMREVESFVQKINRVHGSMIAIDAKEATANAGDKVRVTTLNAATGLESTVVFICGLDNLFDREQALGLDAADRAELVRDHTRQIYMALTRASRRLFVIYRQEKTRELLRGPTSESRNVHLSQKNHLPNPVTSS